MRLPENLFLKSVELTENVEPLKKGFKVNFNKSICVLVGDNGVGKSTVLECLGTYFGFKDDTYLKRSKMGDKIIVDKLESFPIKYLDFHGGDKKFSGAFGDDMILQMQQMRASSGQCTLALVNSGKFTDFNGGLILLDEPCRGLSLKNQSGIGNFVKNFVKFRDCQIVLTTHSLVILKSLASIAQFFSIEMGADISCAEYIGSQLKD